MLAECHGCSEHAFEHDLTGPVIVLFCLGIRLLTLIHRGTEGHMAVTSGLIGAGSELPGRPWPHAPSGTGVLACHQPPGHLPGTFFLPRCGQRQNCASSLAWPPFCYVWRPGSGLGWSLAAAQPVPAASRRLAGPCAGGWQEERREQRAGGSAGWGGSGRLPCCTGAAAS